MAGIKTRSTADLTKTAGVAENNNTNKERRKAMDSLIQKFIVEAIQNNLHNNYFLYEVMDCFKYYGTYQEPFSCEASNEILCHIRGDAMKAMETYCYSKGMDVFQREEFYNAFYEVDDALANAIVQDLVEMFRSAWNIMQKIF